VFGLQLARKQGWQLIFWIDVRKSRPRFGGKPQAGILTVTPANRGDIQRSKTAMVARLAPRLGAHPHFNGRGWLRSGLGDRPDGNALNRVSYQMNSNKLNG